MSNLKNYISIRLILLKLTFVIQLETVIYMFLTNLIIPIVFKSLHKIYLILHVAKAQGYVVMWYSLGKYNFLIRILR